MVGANTNEGGFYELLGRAQGVTPKDPKATPQPGSGGASLSAVNLIGCGSNGVAAARRAQGLNSWRYVYSGDFTNQNIGIPGAYHTAEIPMVFGTTEFFSRRPDTAEEVKLSAAMRRAWAAFSKDPMEGLQKLGWPVYDNESKLKICV